MEHRSRIRSIWQQYSANPLTIPPGMEKGRLPSLDGLRAVAILLVIVGHLTFLTSYSYVGRVFLSPLGVEIIFVLSGFLITAILLKEKAGQGRVSISRFYARRILRIFPASYFYILVILAANAMLNLNISRMSIAGAALYFQNFRFPHQSIFFTHYWTLSIEEQFYLIFPLILSLSLRLFIFLIPSLLLFSHISLFACSRLDSFHGSRLELITHFLITFDGILVGCLLAVLLFKGLVPIHFLRRRKKVIILASACFLLVQFNHRVPFLHHFTSFFIGALLLTNISPSSDFIFRFLNLRVLIWVGVLSYSLYLWQQIFTLFHIDPGFQNIFWLKLPLNLIILFAIAWLTYRFIESPFLRIKKQLH